MSKKVYITRKISNLAISKLQEAGFTVDVNPKDEIISQEELIAVLKDGNYDAVLCLLTDKIGSAVYDVAPTVKIYVNYATGFDNIDVAEADRRGITIANAPAPFTSEAVAEHAIALMLALAARIVEADDFVRQGKYDGWNPTHFIGSDILGKTLGLIGAGRIGERVARYCIGLGMKVVYTDISPNEKIETECGAQYCETPEEVLQKADIVSIHVPLLPSTQHFMNEARLKIMKPTALLINTSRGPVVDENALVKALQDKTIAGAALDVFEFEPKLAPGLIELSNVILTPHIGSASETARKEMAEMAAQNIIDFLNGEVPKNVIHSK